MGVESPVTGQDFASSFFARLGQRMRKLNTILTGKREKKKKGTFFHSQEIHKILHEDLVS